MVLTLLLIAATAGQPLRLGEEPATVTARASVIILRPATGSKASWDRLPPNQQKEVTVTGADGTKTRIRLIEFE
jgi:hypothetical protein